MSVGSDDGVRLGRRASAVKFLPKGTVYQAHNNVQVAISNTGTSQRYVRSKTTRLIRFQAAFILSGLPFAKYATVFAPGETTSVRTTSYIFTTASTPLITINDYRKLTHVQFTTLDINNTTRNGGFKPPQIISDTPSVDGESDVSHTLAEVIDIRFTGTRGGPGVGNVIPRFAGDPSHGAGYSALGIPGNVDGPNDNLHYGAGVFNYS